MGSRNAEPKQGDTGSSAPAVDRSKTGNRETAAPLVDQIRSRVRDTTSSSAPQVDQIRSKDGNKDVGSPSASSLDQIRSRAGNKDTGSPSAPPVSKAGNKDTGSPSAGDQTRSRAGNAVLKSGTLFISSKGIGWTSWKKRWFILTRTSLVFFRSDPSVNPQKGSDVNLTLGGIDLNSSGSVVVKEDKKLLTVLFPNGRDGRAFTLKAETTEDLYDWKTALENALAQAPSAAIVMGQNGIFRNEPSETVDGGFEQLTERQPVKSLVIGRPILLALEDIDGTPSFLEKALTFIEQHGVKVEGILRQSADVDDVNRRVREYEEGKVEFSSEEDAHVIGDCIKHVIRELPSSPVPASCCKALVEACKSDRGGRINAMRAVIAETFPEPNRRLLQRILKMMQVVASHKSENRMSSSAVSACMAPLLLRPLMEGDCELENDFSLGDDNSLQLLQAAAAANHAQAIVITLLEEYDKIFGDNALQEEPLSPEVCSGSEESDSEDEELTDEDEVLDDEDEILEDEDTEHSDDADTEDEDASTETISENSCIVDDEYDSKVCEDSNSGIGSAEGGGDFESNQAISERTQNQNDDVQGNGSLNSRVTSSDVHSSESQESVAALASRNLAHEEPDVRNSSFNKKSTCNLDEPVDKRPTVWGRAPAKKIQSSESVDCGKEDEIEIQKLELTKSELQTKIAIEVKENAVLRASLEQRKKTLHEHRLALEQEVFELQEKLQKERDLRVTMESQLNKPPGSSTLSPTNDKTKVEYKKISQAEEGVSNQNKKVADLHLQLNQQSKNHHGSVCGSCGQPQQREYHLDRQDQEGNPDSRDKSRSSQDTLRKADSENARTDETLTRKQSAEKQQMALIVYEGTKYGRGAAPPSSEGTKYGRGAAPPSSVEPTAVATSPSSNSKKPSIKGEGASSGLSKLTTRLNFLKERRSQIVNELQNIERSRGPDNPSTPVPPKTNPR